MQENMGLYTFSCFDYILLAQTLTRKEAEMSCRRPPGIFALPYIDDMFYS
jgi:hypothetical protein